MRMIDGHVHIERGNYTLDWINEFVKYALERGISEIYFLEHSYRFKEFEKWLWLLHYYLLSFSQHYHPNPPDQ